MTWREVLLAVGLTAALGLALGDGRVARRELAAVVSERDELAAAVFSEAHAAGRLGDELEAAKARISDQVVTIADLAAQLERLRSGCPGGTR